MRYFKLTKKIPFIDIKVNSVIKYDSSKNSSGNAWTVNDEIIPEVIIATINAYLKEIDVNFAIGDEVIYSTNNNNYVCKIIDIKFTQWGPNYEIYDKDHNRTFKNIGQYSIKRCENYWFINSEGNICKTYKGKNKKADMYRYHVNNMYMNMKDAREIRDKLISTFNK